MGTQNKNDEAQKIMDLLSLWLKHWYYFVITFAILGTIGIIYQKTATPVWKISARVSLRHDESLMGGGISKTNSIMSAFGLGSGSENIEDEAIKMKSQGFIKNAVKNLNLNTEYTQSEYWGIYKTNLFNSSPIALFVDPVVADTITRRIKFTLDIKPDKTVIKMKAGKEAIKEYEITTYPTTIETSWGKYTFEKSPHYDLYEYPLNLRIQHSSYDVAAQDYREKLFIDYEKKTSDFINLEFKCKNIPFAKDVLNEVILTYNNEWDKDKSTVSKKTLDFIDKRLILTSDALLEADKQIQQFKDKYNLTAIGADVTYYFERTGVLQAQLLSLENQLNVIDIIVDFVLDEQNKYALIPFNLSTDDNIASAIGKYNERLSRRNELHKTNTQTAIAKSLDEQIETLRKNLITSLENIKKGLQASRDNIKKQENEFRSKLGNVPTIEKDYAILKREQELQRTVYVFLLEMREQSAIRGINILPKLRTIDAPYALNKQASPRLRNIAIVVFLLGMAISLSLVYGIPFLKTLREKK